MNMNIKTTIIMVGIAVTVLVALGTTIVGQTDTLDKVSAHNQEIHNILAELNR